MKLRTMVKMDIQSFLDSHNKSMQSISNDNLKLSINTKICESFEEEKIELRVCSKCFNIINEGYVVGGGDEYYCTDKCLHEEISIEEWENLLKGYDSDNYYTEWN